MHIHLLLGFPCGSDGKASSYNAGDLGLIPGSGRASGEGNGNPLQYSCLENPMDRGAWKATVHGVAKSWTQLSDFTSLSLLQKSMLIRFLHTFFWSTMYTSLPIIYHFCFIKRASLDIYNAIWVQSSSWIFMTSPLLFIVITPKQHNFWRFIFHQVFANNLT